MNKKQFALQQEMLQMILEKLEEIRCGLIDVETAMESKSSGKKNRPGGIMLDGISRWGRGGGD